MAGGGGRGRAFLKKIQRNLACVYTRFFFFFFLLLLFFLGCGERERERERDR